MKKQVISLALIAMVALLASCGNNVADKVNETAGKVADEVTNTVSGAVNEVKETVTEEETTEEETTEEETPTGMAK